MIFGWNVNIHKTKLFEINCDESLIEESTNFLIVQSNLGLAYLGLLLNSKPKLSIFWKPSLGKVPRSPGWKRSFFFFIFSQVCAPYYCSRNTHKPCLHNTCLFSRCQRRFPSKKVVVFSWEGNDNQVAPIFLTSKKSMVFLLNIPGILFGL